MNMRFFNHLNLDDKIGYTNFGFIRGFKIPITDNQKDDNENKFHKYRKLVMILTNKNKIGLNGIEKRGFKTYHIDHKISIWYGFKNGIPESQIADISNLRLIPYKENMEKGIKCIFD